MIPGSRHAVAGGLHAQGILGGLQRLFDLDDASARADAGARLHGVERREQEVVGAGVEPLEELLGVPLLGHEEHVRGGQLRLEPDAAAHVDAVHGIHLPGEDRDDRGLLGREAVPGLDAVARGPDLVAPLHQPRLELAQPVRIAVGDQSPHERPSPPVEVLGKC